MKELKDYMSLLIDDLITKNMIEGFIEDKFSEMDDDEEVGFDDLYKKMKTSLLKDKSYFEVRFISCLGKHG